MFKEIPAKNIKNYAHFYGWYKRDGEVSSTYSIYAPSREKSGEFVLRNNDDDVNESEKELAIKAISDFENRPSWVVAGLIYEMWNDSIYRTITIRNENVIKRIIPKGPYCYDENGLCPFWDAHPEMGKQSYGYCNYIQKGDWMSGGTMLLWDQCKECGINDSDQDDKI